MAKIMAAQQGNWRATVEVGRAAPVCQQGWTGFLGPGAFHLLSPLFSLNSEKADGIDRERERERTHTEPRTQACGSSTSVYPILKVPTPLSPQAPQFKSI